MPGNGIGDRGHNSFGQENLSQGQHQFKAVDENWPEQNNSIWVGSQAQSGFSLISNLKNYNVPQSDIESGHGIPSFLAVNGLNSQQPNLRSEIAGSPFQNQQPALNGFMQGQRQYETNILGTDADPYQNIVTSKDSSILQLHHANGTDLRRKDSGRLPNVQSPVSFNSFGAQEQMGGQHPGALQSLQRQQFGFNDMQLLQQQMILRQLQDNQRQPFQHQGVWQQNAPFNLLSSRPNQAAANHSTTLLNGIPVQDSSNKTWPELLASNPNRQHVGTPATMQGSPRRFDLSSEQSQASRAMDLVFQQRDQSLLGVTTPRARDNLNQTAQIQSENPAMQQVSSFGNSVSRSQHAAPPDDHNTEDGPLVSRQGFYGKLEVAGFSDTAQGKTSTEAVHLHNVATLDPAEEKILFGSDDNLWEAFGGEVNTGLGGSNMADGGGLFGGFPSLQSGSWSALMQSALAETSSVDTGQQEEWSGPSFPSTEPTTDQQQPPMFNNGIKQDQQSAWGESSLQGGSGFAGALRHQLDLRASHERIENLQTDYSPRFMQDSLRENKHMEPSLLARPSNESTQIIGKADNFSAANRNQHNSGSWTHQQRMSSSEVCVQLNERANGWNAIGSSVPGEGTNLKSHGSEMAQQPSQSSRHSRQVHEVHGANAVKTDSFHGLAVGADHLRLAGSTVLHRQDSSTSNTAVNSSSSKAFKDNTHWPQNSQNFNLWRKADSPANSRGSDHLDEGSKELESLGKENSSDLALRKPVGAPKFQYHPMGDLGVEMDGSHRSKDSAYPQSAAQQGFNRFSPVGGFGGSISMNKCAQPSQNMLELLHKLDQSKEGQAASHFSSSDRNDAHEAENSDGSVCQLQRNQSTGSQGFGLQLAPPSQRLQNLDHTMFSRSSSQAPNFRISSDRSEVGHTPFVSAASGPSLSSLKEPYDGGNRKHIPVPSEQVDSKPPTSFISGFPFSRSHVQNRHDAGRGLPGQSVNPTLHRLASHSKVIENTVDGTLPSQSANPSVPNVAAHSVVSEVEPMSQSSLSHVPTQSLFSLGHSTTVPGTTAPGFLKSPQVQSNDNDMQKGVGSERELSPSVSLKRAESSRTAQSAYSTFHSQGHSVDHVPNSISTQSFSLLHQMQAMKSPEVDPSARTLKRFRGPDTVFNSAAAPLEGNQLSYGRSATEGDVQTSGLVVDKKVLNLPSKQADHWDGSSASPHMDALRQSVCSHSSSNSENSLRHEQSQIKTQVVPSWFGQPGTLANGQSLQVIDAQRIAAMKHMEQARHVPKPDDSLLAHEPANQSHHDPVSARTENISSQNSLPPETTDHSLLVKEKKRKLPATVVQAWHKEVMTSARLQSASTTEIEWARAANRLVQKVDDGTESNEDGLPSLRPRKRLVVTTQLMQQLLLPPPAPFLAGDCGSNYVNVMYCVSKSALGDACSAIHYSRDNSSMPNSSEKILLEKPKVSEGSGCEDIAKAVEDLVDRTKKLENELLRLDQRSSIVDLRVELQEIERFSIINRFAKFHGRSQSDGSGASSSDLFASRTIPQRYVMALPMPKNLPDSVQCHSL